MIKLLMSILLSMFLGMSVVSCSFFGSSSEEAAEEVTGADADFGEDDDYDPLNEEDSDVSSLDSASDADIFGGDDTGSAGFDSEEGFDGEGDDFEDDALAAGDTDIEEVTDDELLNDNDPLETANSASDEIEFEEDTDTVASTFQEEDVSTNAPEDIPSEEVTYSEDTTTTADTGDYYDDAPKTWVPVKKIKDAPFNRNGILANAVYLVRPGDTLSLSLIHI